MMLGLTRDLAHLLPGVLGLLTGLGRDRLDSGSIGNPHPDLVLADGTPQRSDHGEAFEGRGIKLQGGLPNWLRPSLIHPTAVPPI